MFTGYFNAYYFVALLASAGCGYLALSKLREAQKEKKRRANASKCKDKNIRALIVGAGFSGIATALKLKELGIPFEIVERSADVGGTWNDNQYPGCQCDIPSYLYSLSSYPTPKAGWSKHFSDQPEILDYIKEVVSQFGLRQFMSFGTTLTSCCWDTKNGKWTITTTKDGIDTTRSFTLVFAATGPLNVPFVPEFEGKELFKGASMHTALWDKTVNLKDKKVTVVGSAASAIQLIPFVADLAKEMHVFQRTPNWLAPKFDVTYYSWVRFALAYIPFLQTALRFGIFLRQEIAVKLLMRGGTAADKIQKDVIHFIKSSNPTIDSEKLIPTYKMGCKRILMSNTFFPALNKPHVHLNTDGIDRFTETGLITKKGDVIDTDVVIWATGFDIRSTFKGAFTCIGPDGTKLTEYLKENSDAFLGASFSKFPNLFTMLGPNTGLGHNSVVYMCEAQLLHIEQLLERLVNSPEGTSITVNSKTVEDYNTEIQNELKDYVWNGCSSWYRNENGKIDSLYPGTAYSFQRRCQKPVNWSQYTVKTGAGSKL
eukprot:TRINITY_DN21887_c0_g1_i1.p1 TRINITY_DN21887_c0_g1~~TRINITY_DN21887_c0_g1_i1.p1  ORF type:complete len:562 (+),score=81.96 TRINITY_DN21887_c0_g1_i1:64-1686(+)